MGLTEKIGVVYDTDLICLALYRANRRFPERTLDFMIRCIQSGMKIYENYCKTLDSIPKQFPAVISINFSGIFGLARTLANKIRLDCKTFVKADKAPCIH